MTLSSSTPPARTWKQRPAGVWHSAHQLVHDCNFSVDCDNGKEIPLVISAVKADHASLVRMLVEEYNATLYANPPIMGENALHLACQNMSRLCYYIIQCCPKLYLN